MISVLLLHITDQVPIDLSMRRGTPAKYDRPRDATPFRDQCCKVESGQVSYGAIQVNATYWKFSDSYALTAVATNLACKAFCSPRGGVTEAADR